MNSVIRLAILGIMMQWSVLAHAQAGYKYSPKSVTDHIDESATFNGKDRPYLKIDIDLDADAAKKRPLARIDPTLGQGVDSFEVTDGSGAKFGITEAYTLAGGIALFGNYKKDKRYTVAILRDVPCYDPETHQHVGDIPAGTAGSVMFTLEGNTGLERKRVIELSPAQFTNTSTTGQPSGINFDFKLGLTEYLGSESYVDFATDGTVSPQKDLSFNQLQGRFNFGHRFNSGNASVELTNTFESTQNASHVNYVLGGQGVFLPPWAISWFSERFAWDPTIKVGYQWAKKVTAPTANTKSDTNRLTYGVHWVVPIARLYALSLEGTGILELVQPVTAKRFHDKTSIGFHVLLHEKNQTKIESLFKYSRGEAAPSFQFNQNLLLGLLLQLR